MHAKDCQHAAVADDDYMDEDELLAEMMSMFNFIINQRGSGFSISLRGLFGGGGGGGGFGGGGGGGFGGGGGTPSRS